MTQLMAKNRGSVLDRMLHHSHALVIPGRAHLGAAILALAGCVSHRPIRPGAAGPIEGAPVEVGSLLQSQAVISLDVLIPADGDIPAALERARDDVQRDGIDLVESLPSTASHPVIAVQLKSVEDEGWSHHLPGYVASKIAPEELPAVDGSAAVVLLDARAPAAQAWDLLRIVTHEARDLARAQHGWIYDSYRAELHSAETFAASMPGPQRHDVRTITRIMGVVSTHGGLDHIRTIGLWRLGLPELYLPDVAPADLHAAMGLVRATAQTLIQNGGVTRRGIIEVDLSKLPRDWPKPASGTGRFTWRARWMRGPIHRHAMLIVLSAPGARDHDSSALAAALRSYAGVR